MHFFNIEVSDHLGCWYIEKEFLETITQAEEEATRVSLKRDNGIARVTKVTMEAVAEFKDGERCDG